METTTIARSMRGSVGMLAMEWLLAPGTLEKAAAAGMAEGPGSYAVGRLGVLGDCTPQEVVDAAFFWDPDTMLGMVEQGRAITAPAEGAAIWARICQEWGDEKLAGMEGVERFGELMDKVVQSAAGEGAPTFDGWRKQSLPDQAGPARTFQLAQTMRELRFGRHCVAVREAGMGPLEAILSGPAGEWNAELFGWKKPYPDVSGLAEQREQVEAATDQMHAPDFEVLTEDERAELRELAKAARGFAGA